MPKKLDEGFIKALKRAGKAYKNLHKPMTNTAASIGSDIAIGAATTGAGALTGSLSGLGTVPGAIIAGTYAVLSGLSSWKDEYKRLRALGESVVFDEKFEENFEEELYQELVDAGLTEEELNAIVKFELTEALVAGILPKIKNALSSNKLNTMKIKSLNNSIPKLGPLKMPKLKTPKLNNEEIQLVEGRIKRLGKAIGIELGMMKHPTKYPLANFGVSRKEALMNTLGHLGLQAGVGATLGSALSGINPAGAAAGMAGLGFAFQVKDRMKVLKNMGESVEDEIDLVEEIINLPEDIFNALIEEFEQLDEISKDKLKAYTKKASFNLADQGNRLAYEKDKEGKYKITKKIGLRSKKIDQAIDKISEDVSPLLDAAIDNNPAEMSNIFDSLIKSRLSDMVETRKIEIANAIFNPSVKEEVEEEITLEDIGITEEQLENMTEEEFEQLDEISKEKLKKYISGAAVSAYQSGYKEGNADGYGGGSNATGGPRRELHAKANKAQAKAEKRLKGIDKAVERIDDPYYGSSGKK